MVDKQTKPDFVDQSSCQSFFGSFQDILHYYQIFRIYYTTIQYYQIHVHLQRMRLLTQQQEPSIVIINMFASCIIYALYMQCHQIIIITNSSLIHHWIIKQHPSSSQGFKNPPNLCAQELAPQRSTKWVYIKVYMGVYRMRKWVLKRDGFLQDKIWVLPELCLASLQLAEEKTNKEPQEDSSLPFGLALIGLFGKLFFTSINKLWESCEIGRNR